MFGWLRKRRDPHDELRALLWADAPLAKCTLEVFAVARAAAAAGDRAVAIAALHAAAPTCAAESRLELQRWSCLRELGVAPPSADSKRVLGVVFEVRMPNGLDTLAAYADRSVRFYHHAGKAILLEGETRMCLDEIAAVLRAAEPVATTIGPWQQPGRGAPPRDHARLSVLTPSGLHFGEGMVDALAAAPLAGPLFAAGTQLMAALFQATRSR